MAQDVSLSWTDRGYLKKAANNSGAGLTFSESRNLATMSYAAWETSQETRRARVAMESVGMSVDSVADQIDRLERGLGLHLEQQTVLLKQQTEVLSQIRDAVLTPARTRAAERVADAAQLLRRERWQRALDVSREGIEADPNNPGVFFAAGWALIGLERPDDARAMFEEARDAADGDERSLGARQAARAALAGGNSGLAYSLVRDARSMAQSDDERAGVAYDVAVYAWLNDDPESAHEALEKACRHDTRYCHMAFTDRNLNDAQDLRDTAATVLTELSERVAERQPEVAAHLDEIGQGLPTPPQSSRSHSQLAEGLRPTRDWSLLQNKIHEDLTEAQRSVDNSGEADTLQGALALLNGADQLLADVEGEARELGEVVAAHDGASREQDDFESQRSEAERDRGRGVRLENATSLIRRNATTWLFWSVAWLLVGLVLPGLLVVGIVLLVVTFSALGVNYVGAEQRQKAEATIQSIDSGLNR